MTQHRTSVATKATKKYEQQLAANIRTARDKLGISRNELVKLIKKRGVITTPRTIQSWEEAARTPSVGVLSVVAAALGVALPRLLPKESAAR